MEKQSSQLTTSFLSRHRAALLVLGSQLMAAVLHALARLLETRTGSQDHVHPFTILQVRLLITGLGCSAYLGWWAKTPDFPLGLPKLRPLLALRALGGLFGACGFYGTSAASKLRAGKMVFAELKDIGLTSISA